jgi:hypothetical protein
LPDGFDLGGHFKAFDGSELLFSGLDGAGGFAEYASTTETEWRDSISASESTPWGDSGLLGALFAGLTSGKPFVVALLEALGQAVFGGLSSIADTVVDWFESLGDAFSGKWTGIEIASTTATQATSQIAVLLAGSIASDVVGGVAVSDEFNGSSASDLGANFTRLSDGAGAGTFGPDGLGAAVWTTSGSSTRRHMDRHNTTLATDYQAVLFVPSELGFLTSGDAYLIGRCDSALDDFVYAKISRTNVEIGCKVGGTWQTPFDDVTLSYPYAAAGDQWLFLIGTDTDDRQFIVKRNGVTQLSVTDSGDVSVIDAANRYCGLGAQALGASGSQARPPSFNMWAGYDRLSTSI